MTSSRALAHLAEFLNGRAFRPDDRSDAGLPILRIRQLVDPKADCDFYDGPLNERHRVDDGDLIFSWSGTLATRIWNRGPAALNQHLFKVHPDPGVDKDWLRWAIEALLPTFRGLMHGSAMTHITMEMLKVVKVDVPSLGDQRRVAAFLNQQTEALDRAGELYARLLSLNSERIDALTSIHLNSGTSSSPNASHQTSMKRLLTKLSRPARWSEGDTVTAFRDGQVVARSQRRAEGYTEVASDRAQVQGVAIGDVVIHGLDGFAGAIGTSESDGICSPVYHVCRPLDGDAEFYGRLLRLMAVNGYLSLFGGSSRERAVDFRNWGAFSQIPIPAVPRRQQEQIGDMIRSMRPLAKRVARIQDLIGERKQAIVAAAITGQFDVTTARAVA